MDDGGALLSRTVLERSFIRQRERSRLLLKACNALEATGISTVSLVSNPTKARLTRYHDLPDYPMGRILRDSRLYTVGAGTQEIRRMLIGREFNEQFKA